MSLISPLARRVLTVCAGVFAALVVLAAPAAAHAELEASNPSQGSVVADEPARVVLRFSEEIVLRLSAVKVIGPDGWRLDSGTPHAGPSGAESMAVDLAADGRHGTYVVVWHVTAADDGHASSGTMMFAVGAASVPAGVAGLGRDRLTSAVYDAGQWIGFAGLAMAGGVAALYPRPRARAEQGSPPWPAAFGWSLLLTGTLIQLLAYAPAARGLPLTRLLDRSLLSVTLATREGHAFMARLAVLALAALVGDAVLRRAAGPALPSAFTLAVAATWGATGHAATGSGTGVAMAAVTLHVAAMAVWVGGLFVIAVLPTDSNAPVAPTVRRFSRSALWAVAVLAATGAYQAWREVGSVSALMDTTYGRLLLAKVAVLVCVVAIARHSREIVATWGGGSAAALRRSVVVELAGASVLLMMAVLLAGNAPAR